MNHISSHEINTAKNQQAKKRKLTDTRPIKNEYMNGSKLYESASSSSLNNYKQIQANIKDHTNSSFIISTDTYLNVDLNLKDHSDNQNHQIQIKSNYLKTFFESFRSFVKEMPYDICLVTNKGERLNAHLIILKNGSNYFNKKLSEIKHESSNSSTRQMVYLKLKEDMIEMDSLKICIEFMYSGGMSVCVNNANNLENLCQTANLLELTDLEALLQTVIRNNMKNLQAKNQLLNTINLNGNFNLLNFLLINLRQNETSSAQLFDNVNGSLPSTTSKNHYLHKLNGQSENHLNSNHRKEKSVLNDDLNDRLLKEDKVLNEDEMSSQLDLNLKNKLSSTPKFIDTAFNLLADNKFLNSLKEYLNIINLSVIDMRKNNILLDKSNCRSLNCHIEIDVLNRDFGIKDKYVYPSWFSEQLEKHKEDELSCYFEQFSFINLNSPISIDSNLTNTDFSRNSLILFCLSFGENEHFKLNNMIINAILNFTDLNILKANIKQNLDILLNQYILKEKLQLNFSHDTDPKEKFQQFSLHVDMKKVFYLKKPMNCKTIKLEQINTSTDCFRAIVEYSRFNSAKETPFVLITCNATVNLIC